jgi:hypothetical protein
MSSLIDIAEEWINKCTKHPLVQDRDEIAVTGISHMITLQPNFEYATESELNEMLAAFVRRIADVFLY